MRPPRSTEPAAPEGPRMVLLLKSMPARLLGSLPGREIVRWALILSLLLATKISWIIAIGLLTWGIVAFFFAARVGYKPWVGWPLAVAGLLGIQYVLVTPSFVRQHDVEGHRQYVDYLAKEKKLPDVKQGWETWQPPLYYLIASVWRYSFSSIPQQDSFRSVQFLSAVLYIATIALALIAFHAVGISDSEAFSALGALALVPGHLFFAARINNDVVLPILGTGFLLAIAGFLKFGEKRWLMAVAVLLVGLLTVKGSSLAVAGASVALIFLAESRRSGWSSAWRQLYWTTLPTGLWLLYWWSRNAAQTGDPLYVNADLPNELLINTPVWQRLFSLNPAAFLSENFYYDDSIKSSYSMALATSLLYGEYTMGGYGFRCAGLLRWACLAALAILALGVFTPPRKGMRSVWLTCLCLAVAQSTITLAYAVKFPYACNQNMRFFAQAFSAYAVLFGFGVGHLWFRFRWYGRGLLLVFCGIALTGLVDFYLRLLF
jgi:hypothetical protein